MFKICFYATREQTLVMEVIIRQGPVPAPGDIVSIEPIAGEARPFLVESRVWHYQNPDPESITLHIYGSWAGG